MTDLAPKLFEVPITAGTHRKADPASSREAAKQVNPGKAHRAILAAFVANGGTGTLDSACAAAPNLLRGSVSRRLSDMKDMKWIRSTERYAEGDHGKRVLVWEVIR